MKGLQVDFIDQDGTYMILFREKPMTVADISGLQLKMLLYNREIPGFLPLSTEMNNLQIKFLFRIEGRRMLSQVLQMGNLTSYQFFLLLNRILMALEELQHYLLDSGNLMLEESFIFVGNGFDDIRLSYLPMSNPLCPEPAVKRIKALILRMIAYVGPMNGEGIRELIRSVHDESIGLPELRAIARKWLQAPEGQAGEIQEGPQIAEQRVPQKSSRKRWLHQPRRSLIISGLLESMLLADIWAWFALKPMEAKLYVTLGVTLLAADVFFVLFKVVGGQGVQKVQNEQEKPILSQPTGMLNAPQATVFLGAHAVLQPEKPYLESAIGGELKNTEITGRRFTIGRAGHAHLLDSTPGVSRVHCELFAEQGKWFVKDLGSINGSYLNGEKMVPYKALALQPGDVIKIVKNEYRYKLA